MNLADCAKNVAGSGARLPPAKPVPGSRSVDRSANYSWCSGQQRPISLRLRMRDGIVSLFVTFVAAVALRLASNAAVWHCVADEWG
jgi:hypothetical protein